MEAKFITLESVQKTAFNEFTITRDAKNFIVKITRPAKSKFANFSEKIVAHFSFRRKTVEASYEAMDKFISEFKAKETRILAMKEETKMNLEVARADFQNPYKVGDIFYDSWGYDQTNIEFYQVVEVKKRSIVIREIERSYNETGFMSGSSVAVKDAFCGEPAMKPVKIRLHNGKTIYSISGLFEWDGKPKYESHYA